MGSKRRIRQMKGDRLACANWTSWIRLRTEQVTAADLTRGPSQTIRTEIALSLASLLLSTML